MILVGAARRAGGSGVFQRRQRAGPALDQNGLACGSGQRFGGNQQDGGFGRAVRHGGLACPAGPAAGRGEISCSSGGGIGRIDDQRREGTEPPRHGVGRPFLTEAGFGHGMHAYVKVGAHARLSDMCL